MQHPVAAHSTPPFGLPLAGPRVRAARRRRGSPVNPAPTRGEAGGGLYIYIYIYVYKEKERERGREKYSFVY